MKNDILKPGELILRKPNILIRCFSEMQGVKREFFNHLIYKSQKAFTENIEHTTTMQELKASLEYTTNDYEFIKKHLLMMKEANISWDKAGEDKYAKHHAGFLNVFEYLNIDKDKGIIYWKYTPTIRDMAALYKEYTSFDLEVLRLFDSQYALAFFEYCTSYSAIGKTGEKKLEHFRALIGIENNKYKEFWRMNDKVINKSKKEIKEKTDFNIDVKTIKQGTTIKKLEGYIRNRKHNSENQTEQPIINLLRKVGGNNKSIEALRNQFSDEVIQSTLNNLQFPDTVKYKMSYLKRVLTQKITNATPLNNQHKQPASSQATDNNNKQLTAEEKKEFRLTYWKKLDNVQKLKHFEDAKNRNLPFLKHIESKAMELAEVLLNEFTSTTEFKWMFDVLFL